jgi:hypothetical protein
MQKVYDMGIIATKSAGTQGLPAGQGMFWVDAHTTHPINICAPVAAFAHATLTLQEPYRYVMQKVRHGVDDPS